MAVAPRPDLKPFFALVAVKASGKECCGGSDGLCSHDCILPPGAVVIAAELERRTAGRSQLAAYQAPRPRKLSADERRRIRIEANAHSLRDLAADYGVSHETIRAVVRGRDRVPAGALPASGIERRAAGERSR